MADTGAPHFIPFVEPTDLVREYPAADEASAFAVAAALDAAGGLVAVKSALFTGTQTQSVTANSNFAVTDLSITHEVAEAGNKLIISAFIGSGGNSNGRGQVGIAVAEGTSLLAVGASPGNRAAISAGTTIGSASTSVVTSPSVTFVHTPSAGSKIYTVRAINVVSSTQTVFINRNEIDQDSPGRPRSVSSLVIQEVRA